MIKSSESVGGNNAPAAMRLAAVRAGQAVALCDVEGGRQLRHRLAEMGLLPGTKFTVEATSKGPFIVCVKNTRMVLGHGLVEKIRVKPAS